MTGDLIGQRLYTGSIDCYSPVSVRRPRGLTMAALHGGFGSRQGFRVAVECMAH